MDFKEFHDLAMKNYENGGDIVSTYDEEDFNEWVETLGGDIPSEKDLMELCEFYRECETLTGVKVGGVA